MPLDFSKVVRDRLSCHTVYGRRPSQRPGGPWATSLAPAREVPIGNANTKQIHAIYGIFSTFTLKKLMFSHTHDL